MSFRQDGSYSLFEALRPADDSDVTHAIVSTYSLDLVALLGLVLTLGKANEEFETGPIGLIDAFRQMRGRLKVLCQTKRIVVPRKHHAVLLLLDGMVRQIEADERKNSWHPKFAIVRYRSPGGPNWRFWVGSRNLTGSRDFEAGLLLTGKVGGGRGVLLHELAELADQFLEPDDLLQDIRNEFRQVRWSAPSGVGVTKIHWRDVGTILPFLQRKDRRPRPTIAISPFISEFGVDAALAFSGGGAVGLLTTEESACGFEFPDTIDARVMGSPEPLGNDSSEAPVEAVQNDFQDFPIRMGLHAKMILQTRGAKSVLFVGSSNLTRRGLHGPNAEILAELEISDVDVVKSINEFFDCRPRPSQVKKEEENTDAIRTELDDDIASLGAVEFKLAVEAAGLVLNAAESLGAFLSRNTLFVQLFSLPSSQKQWHSGMASLLLYEGDLPLKSRTSLVIFEAVSNQDPGVKRRWTQNIAFPDLDSEKRDRAAIAAYVGPSRFKDWLRSTLEGVVPSESHTWTGEPRIGGSVNPTGPDRSPFALEYVLGRWARNPDEFERRVPEIRSMLLAFREEVERGDDGPDREAARGELDEVERFWTLVSEALAAGSP